MFQKNIQFIAVIILFAVSLQAEEPKETIIVSAADQYQVNFLETSPSETKLSGEALQSEGAQTLADITQKIPNLTFTGGTARPRFFQIRGIGERELFEGIPSSSIGFVIDDIDFSGIGSASGLFDIDSIDVVKGPDNFSSGPAGFAGGIHVKSADPTNYDTGKAEIILGSDELFSGGVAVGGKVGDLDALTFRASLYKSVSDGFRKNTFLNHDDTNGRDAAMGRLKLRAALDDDTSITLNTFHINNNDGYDVFTIDNDFNTESDRPGVDQQKTNAVSLTYEELFKEHGTLTDVISFARSGMRQSYDGDWGNNDFWAPYIPYDFFYDQRRRPKTVSNDLKFISNEIKPMQEGDSQATAGLYLARISEDSSIDQSSDGMVYDSVDSNYHTTSVSPYGVFSYVIAPTWVASLGVRGDFRSFEFNDSREANFSEHDNLLSGIASLRKYLNDSDYLFYNLSRSEKPGGVNPGISITPDRKLYSSESLLMNELGAFAQWSNRSAAKLTAFYGNRQDQQVRTSFQSDPNDPLTFAYFTDNAASGNLYGLELETVTKLFDRVSLRVSGALLRTEINDLVLIDHVVNGRDQSYAPRWSYDSSVDYDFGRGWYAGAGVGGKDKFFYDDSHDQISSVYNLLDAHVGYQTAHWNIELWGTNLGNERYGTRGFFFGNEPPNFEAKKYVQLGDPRMIGVTVSYGW